MKSSTGLEQQGEGIEPSIISKITNNSILLKNGIHIMYTFYEREKYIQNAANYICEGFVKGHMILLVDKIDIYKEITVLLLAKGYNKHHLESIIFLDNDQFYLSTYGFDIEASLRKLNEILQPYLSQGVFIRTWGQVSLPENDSLLSKLRVYECEVNKFVGQHKMISVCTYNGLTIPSYIQNEMLKVHHYLMTDNEVRVSPFYNSRNLSIPSGEELKRLEKIDEENKQLHEKNKLLQEENDFIKMKKAVIEESEKFYRALIDEIPITILITKEDHIIYVNRRGKEKLLGASIVGNHFTNLFASLPRNSVNGLSEYVFLPGNSDSRYFEIKSIPLCNKGDDAILHVLIDLTQQKLNEKLMIRTEKLSIAGELAAGIAHEVRNPLTAIKGFIQLLDRIDDGNKEYLNIINDEIIRIEQISSELLMLAKPHSDNYKTANIIEIIQKVKTLLDTQAIMKSIEIELISKKNELNIYCEETKIRQVFINLIKNAIEVMDQGKILIHVREHNDYVQVDIIDHGEGMSKEILTKIGEPFYTTKEKGTGLGLMVCYKIIENHQGSIDVNSQQGIGTTFTVTLPLSTIK
ncbi:ATP-binding protein [Neobacillus jeddahensis]|uniref:ATP-binding protein n=1 Tax=Neobacillus jeddahensis TaxID=1461580 RepID=UPI000693D1BF|nr:ATP-binding protein [Neobacillus jeddahensis]